MKQKGKRGQQVTNMKMQYVKLGSSQTKTTSGFIRTDENGEKWDLYKCFFDNNGKYGEMYINISNQGNIEISKKDSDYALDLLNALKDELL